MGQKRRIERLRLNIVAGKTRPVLRECLYEPRHSEDGENAFRRSTFEEVIGEFGDPWNQPSLILRLRRPEEDRVVAQSPVDTRQDEIERCGVFRRVDRPNGQPERTGIFGNAVSGETQPVFDISRVIQSASSLFPQSLQGVSKNDVRRPFFIVEM